MSDANRYDAIIDRYINGEMAPAEEADFRKLLDLDGELRGLFEADLRMVATMRAEREALERIDHAENYSRFLMSLAASVPATADHVSTATAATASDSDKRWLRWLPGGLALLLVGAIAITVAYRDPAPSPPRIPPAVEHPATGGLPPSISTPPARTRREAPSGPADTDRSERTRDATGDRPQRDEPPPIVPRDSGRGPRRTPSQVKPLPERSREEIPMFEDDTIRTRLKMEHADR